MGTYNGGGYSVARHVEDRTMDLRHDPTPIFGFMAVGGGAPQPPRGSNLTKVLAIAGAVAIVLFLLCVGGMLVSATFCPCTIGADTTPAGAQQDVTINTGAPYDVASCASGGGTS